MKSWKLPGNYLWILQWLLLLYGAFQIDPSSKVFLKGNFYLFSGLYLLAGIGSFLRLRGVAPAVLEKSFKQYQLGSSLALIPFGFWLLCFFAGPTRHFGVWNAWAASGLVSLLFHLMWGFLKPKFHSDIRIADWILLVCSISISIVLLEVALRMVAPSPSIQGRQVVSGPGNHYWYFKGFINNDQMQLANQWGLLDPDVAEPGRHTTIIYLGDSIPASEIYPDNFPTMAEQQLNREQELVIILNAAIAGYGTQQIERLYVDHLSKGPAHQWVIYGFYLDDVNRGSRRRKDNYIYVKDWPQWFMWCYRNSRIFQLTLNQVHFGKYQLACRNGSYQDRLPQALRSLERIEAEAQQRRARLAVFNIPVFRWDGILGDVHKYEHRRLNKTLEK